MKIEKSVPCENKKYTAESLKDLISGNKNNLIQSQLIIRTPPFPFVHIPLLPDVAEIKEISMLDDFYAESLDQLSSEHIGCYCDVDESELASDDAIIEDLLDYDDKFTNLLNKNDDVTGSVLECVENIVTTKQSSMYSSKSTFSSTDNNVEDLENMQKFEKELALKFIAKLHSKKKKQIHDSLICQICKDKHFTAQATLIHHYRSHAGIKPYVCKICESTFTRQHSLNYHMLIHQNLSRFTCEFCERTFRHPSHYKEHLRRHTGETPYHCTDCNLHFKTRNTFKRHLKTRHGKLLTAHGVEDLTAEEFSKFRTNPRNKKH
ncbi:zinc finger protein 69 homolog [Stegodyphus dumicola]|uniref:zinc finger protein 69 homolog n=1 Tax=Stegodyphus dumicola TaxID=202533 RepID=UPI0015A77816|nr:zinc finger protein 69 homolog [Stegodyphus dumicola]